MKPTKEKILNLANFLAMNWVYNNNNEFIFDVQYHLADINDEAWKFISNLVVINNKVYIDIN